MNPYMDAALDDAEWLLGDIVTEARQWDGRGSDLFILVEAQEHDEFLEAYMSQAMRLFDISSRAAKLLFDVNVVRNNPRELNIDIGGIEYADICISVGPIQASVVDVSLNRWTFRGDNRMLMQASIDQLMKDRNPDLLRPAHRITWSRLL